MSHHKEFQRLRQERRRRAILEYLRDEPDFTLSFDLLHMALRSELEKTTLDTVVGETDWLRGQGLVTVGNIGHLPAVTLTGMGKETAVGERVVDGVQKDPL